MDQLAQKKCIPCQGGVPPLSAEACGELHRQIDPRWSLNPEANRLSCSLSFEDFKRPFELAIAIGELAEAQWHHPELQLGWGHLDIQLWTHKIDGLVESDFILAAKIDQILAGEA